MYNVYAIIKAVDSCDREEPYVLCEFATNDEDIAYCKLLQIYNEYIADVKDSFSDAVNGEEIINEILEEIYWEDRSHSAFIDESGFKKYVKYSIVKVM